MVVSLITTTKMCLEPGHKVLTILPSDDIQIH